MKNRVFVTGHYGFHSAGDDAILAAIVAALRSIREGLEIECASASPEETAAAYRVKAVAWSDALAVSEAVRKSDLVIVGGGGLFQDHWGIDPGAFLTDDHSGIGFYTAPALLGALYGKPVFLYAVGVGPLSSKQAQLFTRVACQAASIVSVRDAASKRLLKSIGVDVTHVEVTADAAFAFEAPKPPGKRNGMSIAVAVQPWEFGVVPAFWETELASALDRHVTEHGGAITLVPLWRLGNGSDDDLLSAQRIRDRMKHGARAAIAGVTRPADICEVFGNSDLVIGMRLHSLVLGALSGTPVLALSYDTKISELMRQLRLQRWLVDLRSMDREVLGRLIDGSLAARDRLRRGIAGRVRHLHALALANARRAIDLLDQGRDPSAPFTAEMREVLGRGLQANLRRNQAMRSELQGARAEISLCMDRIQSDAENAEHASLALEQGKLDAEEAAIRRVEYERLASETVELRARIQQLQAEPDSIHDPLQLPPGLPAQDTSTLFDSVKPAPVLPDRQDPGDLFAAATRPHNYDIVVCAIFDFDFRFQRPQQTALALARRGHRVFWISPFRTAPPSHPRGYEAIRLGDRLWEVRLRERHDIYLGNLTPAAAQAAYRSVRELYRDFAVAENCVVVQFPFWRQLGVLLRQELHARLIYDCMDDWQNWTAYPGISDFNLAEEKKLDEQADLVVVSSEEYRRRREQRGVSAVIVRNGVDFDFFRSPAKCDLRMRLKRPIVGYFGAISDWFDGELLSAVAAARPQYSFVLIGQPGGEARSRIRRLPNIHLLGEKNHREIPGYLSQFDACLIPFLLNEVTQGVDPVKLYEYLSQGKPVVATALPELPSNSGVIYIAGDADDFLAKLDRALQEDNAELRERRVEYARKNTWSSRAAAIETAIAPAFPRVSILIVTYDSAEFLGLCLWAIRQNTAWPNYEVIVVDNASADDTVTIAERHVEADARVRVIPLERNTGFAGGNNAAAREASGDYLVFLNADTVVTPGWLERLVRHCHADPRIGQVAAVTNFSGNETKVHFSYSNAVEMLEFASELAYNKAGEHMDVGVAPLYCVLMPRPVWQVVGELDEEFRIGTFEDDDLSLRVRQAGYRVVVADDAFVHHFGNGSFRSLPEEQASQIFLENQQHYQAKWNQPAPRHKLRPGVRSPYQEPRFTPAEFVNSLPQPKLSLKALHPGTAQVGVGFNLQANLESALGVTCANATPNTVIVLSGRALPTAYGGPASLSALVPADLIGRAGRHQVCLKDGKEESNSLDLVLLKDVPALRPEVPLDALPLISCIMPTADRRAFVPRAIRQFLKQDYPNRELIIVDAGHTSIADLIPPDPRIRLVHAAPKLSLGTLRNLGCREARGDYIAHWDDDDWIASWRLSYQLQALVQTGSDVCGIDRMIYWDPVRNQSWRYIYPRHERPWLAGGSLLYRRTLWEQQPFQDIDVGEDNVFVWSEIPKRMAHLDHEDFYIALLHRDNTSPKIIDDTRWIPIDPGPIIAALGPEAVECRDLVFQHERSLSNAAPAEPKPATARRLRSHDISGFTFARRADLELPEFFALPQACPVPHLPEWEFPFALFQANLSDHMTVLDCTIDAAGFEQLVMELYSGIDYRHWDPVRREASAIEAEMPAGRFDRIFCRHTLEQLTGAQRSLLISALASRLKPGGRLILTCAYTFNSRSAEAGGISPREVADLCGDCGLIATGATPDAPDIADEDLYLRQEPLPHATVGAVFLKPGAAEPTRRIVLGLLSWNTRNVALESLAALCGEARMLQRAGLEAAICVVDNGSTDGTAEALNDLDAGFGLPHRFLLNPANLGSSRARNQMIDYMLEWGADYILFVDGDIEIVPCSSFAMLRHMESSGTRLGCLGAYSAHCTAERPRATPALFSLKKCRVHRSEVLAWTQYGMFRREMFEDGIRFDEAGPFGEPGHGLEDVDFAIQMVQKGYANEYFEGIRYLHRNLSSSVDILRRHGVNPTVQYYRRKEFLLKKWEGLRGLREESMEWVRNARAPWPEDVSIPALGDLKPLPPVLLRLAEQFASGMINAPDLSALAAALASFSWTGKELVVEIGAYVGSTTVFIAKVLEELAVRASIIAIDPFERCEPDALNPQGKYAQFISNIRAHGVEDRCVPLVAFSADAACAVPDRIGVLFIDGSHHYEAVRADLELYVPKVVPGGFVYVHDYFDAYPGVIRAVDEYSGSHPNLVLVGQSNYIILRVRE